VTERDFEQRLRRDFRQMVDEAAPPALRAGVIAIPDVVSPTLQRRFAAGWGFPPMSRFAPLALAATAVVVAILVGIGLLARSPNVGPSPVPGPTHSATPHPTTLPTSAAWTATGSMTEGRSQPSATLLKNGKVLVAGGQGTLGGTASAELYDPASGVWTSTGNMLTADYGFPATLLADGRVLAVHNNSYGTAELYDPASGTWTATGNMVTGHYGGTATLLPDGRVLVAGDNYNPQVDPVFAELYDPTSGTWAATGGMVAPRVFHTATLLPDGRVLVAGGAAAIDGKTRLATAELYDPASGTWSATRNMNVARGNSSQAFTATLLADGRVLVAGGAAASDGHMLASAELYDPNSGTWSLAGSMKDGRQDQTATLLRDGRVLVTGGLGGPDGSPTASAELYDPNSGPLGESGIGSWSVTPSLAEARDDHTAILLSNGTVLVMGGFGNPIFNPDTQQYDLPFLSSVELYDPGSGS
jgi:hypothetical protein